MSFENKHNYIIELIELQQPIYESLYFYQCNFQLQKNMSLQVKYKIVTHIVVKLSKGNEKDHFNLYLFEDLAMWPITFFLILKTRFEMYIMHDKQIMVDEFHPFEFVHGLL